MLLPDVIVTLMSLPPGQLLSLSLDPAMMFELSGLKPDTWQRDLLGSPAPRILLNCCRQAGKSTAVAALALHNALFAPKSLVLLLSRGQRQSSELFRKVVDFYNTLHLQDPHWQPVHLTTLHLELANGSRIISLPGEEQTLRGYSGVQLLIIDEAARVPDDLYKAVRPMLAISGGRLICLSTPFGRRGFFYEAWQDQLTPWLRFVIPAAQVPRISRDFLDEELRTLGRSWYNQEYACCFEALEGLVYPDFPQCIVSSVPPLKGKELGGIDFGFRNPFAAVWGVLDASDVLWLTGEHYACRQPLNAHAAKLPRCVEWYADPAGAADIAALRCGGFIVRKGDNSLRPGIAAVTSRIQTGRLRVHARACPQLIAEAGLYRYPSSSERESAGENPIDEHNHALAALRYLVSRLDAKFMVRFRRGATPHHPFPPPASGEGKGGGPDGLDPWNDELWTTPP